MSDDSPTRPGGDPRTYAGWVSAFECSTDFEADMVRDRLDEAGVPAVVLTQRDHSFNLNVGDLSSVHVMVPPESADQARALLAEGAPSDADLEAAAMSADVMAPDAHEPEREAMLDSGLDSLSLSVPDDIADDAETDDGDLDDDAPRPHVGHHSFATLPPADASDAEAEDERGTMGAGATGYSADDGSPAGSPLTGVHAAPPPGPADDEADETAAAYDPTRPDA